MSLTSPAGGGPRRIVLTTFGSLGDLHPYIAIALALQARGHDVVIATSEFYRGKLQSLGISLAAVRPDVAPFEGDPDFARRIMDRRKGTEMVVREVMMSVLRDSYEDMLAAADGADLLVSHPLTFTTRLVAEKKGLPWVSTLLSPIGLLSAYDPPVLPLAPFLAKLRFLGPRFFGPLHHFAKWTIRSWSKPWHRLRAEIGLAPVRENPLFEAQHSPIAVLALFSKWFSAKQPDWPSQTTMTGFAFFDQHGSARLDPDLARFLDEGPAPIVFTLGSSAVKDAGSFYESSVIAAKQLGRRAILLVGSDPRNRIAALPDGMATFEYAPFSQLFPRAAVVVHQGGVGTTSQALRAGPPMLVMPYAHDQLDNADRVARLGVARTISRASYTPARVTKILRELLENPKYARRGAMVSKHIQEENGTEAACDALEAALRCNGSV